MRNPICASRRGRPSVCTLMQLLSICCCSLSSDMQMLELSRVPPADVDTIHRAKSVPGGGATARSSFLADAGLAQLEAPAGKRIALLIGNQGYVTEVGPLKKTRKRTSASSARR